jgi:hypothetical protein
MGRGSVIGIDLVAAALAWTILVAASSLGLTSIFRIATKPIAYRLDFKPFNCAVCMSFWMSLPAAVASWYLTFQPLTYIESATALAVVVSGSVGMLSALRRLFPDATRTVVDSGTAPPGDSDSGLPPVQVG